MNYLNNQRYEDAKDKPYSELLVEIDEFEVAMESINIEQLNLAFKFLKFQNECGRKIGGKHWKHVYKEK
jgi:hypothetical protein